MSTHTTRRREIYRYTAKETIFAATWSNKVYPEKKIRIALSTLLDGDIIDRNKIYIVELDETLGEFILKATYSHGYPASSLQFIPNSEVYHPELIASASNNLKVLRYYPETSKMSVECELSSKKFNNYSAPLTSLDWNELDSSLICTSSIDTTCTIWNLEIGQPIAQTSTMNLKGRIKTQLIAHETPVHDISFARLDNGRDQFATAGADGSIRLFDLRHLQHSTILYEDSDKRPLNCVKWNRQDPTKLATVSHESRQIAVIDVRLPCRPIARFGSHRDCVNGIAWAPTSSLHLCTAGNDKQALIWEINSNKDEPILAYTADGEISHIHWAKNFNQWICICFLQHMEILRV